MDAGTGDFHCTATACRHALNVDDLAKVVRGDHEAAAALVKAATGGPPATAAPAPLPRPARPLCPTPTVPTASGNVDSSPPGRKFTKTWDDLERLHTDVEIICENGEFTDPKYDPNYKPKGKEGAKPGTPDTLPKIRGPFANADVRDYGDHVQTNPIRLPDIIHELFKRTDGWPRRVGDDLFIDHGEQKANKKEDGEKGDGERRLALAPDRIQWTRKTSTLFSDLQKRTVVEWRQNTGCVTKDELFEALRRDSQRYEGVELLPHEPPIVSHYYACETPAAGDGAALKQFLDVFRLGTQFDRDLRAVSYSALHTLALLSQ